jgi:cysteine-rich repeat protein
MKRLAWVLACIAPSLAACGDDGGSACEGAECPMVCESAAACDDADPCTLDACGADGACAHAPQSGAVCDADGDTATADVCVAGACAASMCGDGVVDARSEACDDQNGEPQDGCENDCTATPTAFRAVTVRFADPHTWRPSLSGCEDNASGFDDELQMDVDNYDLNIILVFRPLDPAAASTPVDIVFGADCMDGATRPACQLASGQVASLQIQNQSSGTCFQPDAATLNPDYTPPPNTTAAPCFVTEPRDLDVPIGSVLVPFTDATAAATYAGSPVTNLASGVFAGFVSEDDAKSVVPNPTFPSITLYSFLAAGEAEGSSCSTEDDRDEYMGTSGFWFYLELTAELIDWSEP